jgi:hypothetical protein
MGSAKKLVRVVQETRTFIEAGTTRSTNPQYWEKDFVLTHRVEVGELKRETLDGLREPTTKVEEAVFYTRPKEGRDED